jgi:hypothetical protein
MQMSGSTLRPDNANAEMHTGLLLKFQPSFSENEIATEKLKEHKLIDGPIGHILAELNQAGGNTLHSEIDKYIHSV